MNTEHDNMILPLYKEQLPPANRIPRDDERYNILKTIPPKDYDPRDGVAFVYLTINNEKDYFITLSIRPKTFEDKSSPEYDKIYHKMGYPAADYDSDNEEETVVEIQIQIFRYDEDENRVEWVSGEYVVM